MERQLLKKAEFLRNLFDAVPSILLVVDEDVRILGANEAAVRVLGQEEEVVLLKRGGEVLHCMHSMDNPGGCGRSPHCMDCVIRNSVVEAFMGKKTYRKDTVLHLLTGGGVKEVFFMITTSPFTYEGREYALLIMEDVTEQKKSEKALDRYARRLEAANRELEAFGYSVSHDLKAPLRKIETLSSGIAGNFPDSDPDSAVRLSDIHEAACRSSQIIDDLLHLSRLALSEILREEVDLSAMAEEVAADIMRSTPDRRISFSIAGGLKILADRRYMRIALENLLGNAVKFTSGGDNARIEFGSTCLDEEQVFFVRDNGAGFDMSYADRLFRPFSRLHNLSEFPGTGIGLSTVQRIISRHGGRVWAEAEAGKGASFFFTLG